MEIPSREVGDRVLARLRDLDQVAYIRFASVFKQFEDLGEFRRALRRLKTRRRARAVAGEATRAPSREQGRTADRATPQEA